MYEIYSKLLQEKGLTSYKVSKMAGVSQCTISDWKSGRHHPNAENMRKIAKALGTTPEYIETGNESAKKEPAISGKLSETDIKFLEALHSVPEEQRQLVLSLLDSMKGK